MNDRELLELAAKAAEPTSAMYTAAWNSSKGMAIAETWKLNDAYKAMLTAAPEYKP
jgi:hypothetical protein